MNHFDTKETVLYCHLGLDLLQKSSTLIGHLATVHISDWLTKDGQICKLSSIIFMDKSTSFLFLFYPSLSKLKCKWRDWLTVEQKDIRKVAFQLNNKFESRLSLFHSYTKVDNHINYIANIIGLWLLLELNFS